MLPKIYSRTIPPLWGAVNVSGENKRLLLKWYIGNLQIPRREKKIPSNASREFARLLGKRPA